jgi:hypothetical protein
MDNSKIQAAFNTKHNEVQTKKGKTAAKTKMKSHTHLTKKKTKKKPTSVNTCAREW